MAKSAEARWPLAMSAVDWGAVYYSLWCAHGEKAAEAKLHEIAQLPVEIVGVDMELGPLPPLNLKDIDWVIVGHGYERPWCA